MRRGTEVLIMPMSDWLLLQRQTERRSTNGHDSYQLKIQSGAGKSIAGKMKCLNLSFKMHSESLHQHHAGIVAARWASFRKQEIK